LSTLYIFGSQHQHCKCCCAVLVAGAHPSTQRAALALFVNHLGPDVAAAVNQAVTPPDTSTAEAGKGQQGPAAAAAGTVLSSEHVLQQRAEAAAEKLLRSLQ
jgi:hypothetical protein